MKAETQVRCTKRGCKGVLCAVPVSRLEAFLTHRVYQCDQCGERWKFTGTDRLPVGAYSLARR